MNVILKVNYFYGKKKNKKKTHVYSASCKTIFAHLQQKKKKVGHMKMKYRF